MIGTDYGHNDQSAEIEALRNLRESGGLDERAYRKITDANARAPYAVAVSCKGRPPWTVRAGSAQAAAATARG